MPTTTDLPPQYTTALVQEHTLPMYTECPMATEHVLHTTVSSPTGSSSSRDLRLTRQFKYTTEYLEIDLGEFSSLVMHPAYGLNGMVEGTVKFRTKCTHVLQMTVKVLSYPPLTFRFVGPPLIVMRPSTARGRGHHHRIRAHARRHRWTPDFYTALEDNAAHR